MVRASTTQMWPFRAWRPYDRVKRNGRRSASFHDWSRWSSDTPQRRAAVHRTLAADWPSAPRAHRPPLEPETCVSRSGEGRAALAGQLTKQRAALSQYVARPRNYGDTRLNAVADFAVDRVTPPDYMASRFITHRRSPFITQDIWGAGATGRCGRRKRVDVWMSTSPGAAPNRYWFFAEPAATLTCRLGTSTPPLRSRKSASPGSKRWPR
jgi:hypothetical protein